VQHPARCSNLKGIIREDVSAIVLNYAVKNDGISEAAFRFLVAALFSASLHHVQATCLLPYPTYQSYRSKDRLLKSHAIWLAQNHLASNLSNGLSLK